MGIRYRQEVCERWIRNNTPVQEVLKNLREANFDPEFHKRYEAELIKQYNRLNPSATITSDRFKFFSFRK